MNLHNHWLQSLLRLFLGLSETICVVAAATSATAVVLLPVTRLTESKTTAR
jgi:hypothetical protein